MGIFKLIVILLLGWAGFMLYRSLKNSTNTIDNQGTSGQKMLSCCMCKTHIPENEAIIQDTKIYCSKECL
jgi:uncharacterized protein